MNERNSRQFKLMHDQIYLFKAGSLALPLFVDRLSSLIDVLEMDVTRRRELKNSWEKMELIYANSLQSKDVDQIILRQRMSVLIDDFEKVASRIEREGD